MANRILDSEAPSTLVLLTGDSSTGGGSDCILRPSLRPLLASHAF
jgi:hypothetical protein